jgi:hypothetical protein
MTGDLPRRFFLELIFEPVAVMQAKCRIFTAPALTQVKELSFDIYPQRDCVVSLWRGCHPVGVGEN